MSEQQGPKDLARELLADVRSRGITDAQIMSLCDGEDPVLTGLTAFIAVIQGINLSLDDEGMELELEASLTVGAIMMDYLGRTKPPGGWMQ